MQSNCHLHRFFFRICCLPRAADECLPTTENPIFTINVHTTNRPAAAAAGGCGSCAAGKESDKFVKPSGSNFDLERTRLHHRCFSVVISDKWGGAAAIAVNQTCIKLVATIRTMHDADAAAVATDAEECVRIAADRVRWGSRLHRCERSTPV